MSNATESQKTTYYYKLFRVKRNDGRVTTVSMNPVLVTKACQVMGGLRVVGKLVRESALTYDDSMHKNCSGFVSEKLRQALQTAISDRKQQQDALTAEVAN